MSLRGRYNFRYNFRFMGGAIPPSYVIRILLSFCSPQRLRSIVLFRANLCDDFLVEVAEAFPRLRLLDLSGGWDLPNLTEKGFAAIAGLQEVWPAHGGGPTGVAWLNCGMGVGCSCSFYRSRISVARIPSWARFRGAWGRCPRCVIFVPPHCLHMCALAFLCHFALH